MVNRVPIVFQRSQNILNQTKSKKFRFVMSVEGGEGEVETVMGHKICLPFDLPLSLFRSLCLHKPVDTSVVDIFESPSI